MNLTDYMFSGCTELTSINLEGLYSGSIQDMSFMFENCENLKYLNIYNLDTRDVLVFTNIFDGIKNKIEIIYNENKTNHTLKDEIEKRRIK